MTERIEMVKVLAAKHKKLGVNIARWKAGERDPITAGADGMLLIADAFCQATIQEIVDELDLGIQFRKEREAIA